MPVGPRHEIAELVRAPGELCFEARLGGEARQIWIRSSTAVTPPADPALAICLMPAMSGGGTLTMAERVSPRVLRGQREFQAIQAAWSRDWGFHEGPRLREVEVIAPPRPPEAPTHGRVATFFSGGVDSWATVLGNPDVTDLIFVRGIDILPRLPQHEGLADAVEERLRDAAADLGLPLHVVETNLRDLADHFFPWQAYNGCAMVALALFFEPLFGRVLIAGDTDYATQVPLGVSRLVSQLWSTEGLEVVEEGGRLSRTQRLRRIVDDPIVQRTLRVCWENPGGAYNCGRCRKCMLTMVPLEAIGARHKIATFPAELDLTVFPEFEANTLISLVLWEDVLETARAADRPDIEAAVEPLVARGRSALGVRP